MKNLNIKINVNSNLYLKNPDTSELGNSIISNSIELIDELGFEKFTFKKLSIKINSPESSIYRYFKSKHTLLIYLTSWYWSWTDYRLVLTTININSPKEKLKRSLNILTEPVLEDKLVSYVNEVLLHKIISTESVKAYQTKDVDEENKNGCFTTYKNVVNQIANLILEINPTFKFPHMLISTVVEGSHRQRYYSAHIPSLTDTKSNEDVISKFYSELVFKMIK
ncbi:TetR/AcrR family transcriptional regulator [Lutibacter sp.]|uniref:TetR/AcrR family transcriptional regulator n=1 Tax=Lutibacter sp. TaxID=1925666 RepID=UPI0025C4B728|nr:TetR/AcrR family transcriptional regulator [Lutibacter sp.]MCF6182848.1 TetR/AcrR family transcriptional regulator [Lutibacter sp.]